MTSLLLKISVALLFRSLTGRHLDGVLAEGGPELLDEYHAVVVQHAAVPGDHEHGVDTRGGVPPEPGAALPLPGERQSGLLGAGHLGGLPSRAGGQD